LRAPFVIGCRGPIGVLAAIHLDNQVGAGAEEIYNVRTDGLLATKGETFHLMTPQSAPEFTFSY
jgi:hypothetical protein